MEGAIALIVESVRVSQLTQAILATVLVIVIFAIWREIAVLRRIRRQNKAIFTSPLLSAREVFPDGYLQRTRGMYYSSKSAGEAGRLHRSDRI